MLVGAASLSLVGVTQASAATADAAATPSTSVDEVVVTGSRIARQDYVAASPLVTVSPKALQDSGAVTVEALLNQVPQFVPSVTSTSNNPSNGGQANVELRGLGPQRTMVLIDGRRAVPSNSNYTVDLNTIPDALIENIEIITGGASATYGSDAMAGVLNFKLNHHFTGVQIDAQYGQTSRNDGAQQDVSVTAGSNFEDDKGNAVVSFEYSNRERIFNANRTFSSVSGPSGTTPYGQYDAVGSNLPTQAAVNTVFSGYGVAPGTLLNTQSFGFNPDGTLFRNGVNYKGSTALDFSTIPLTGSYNTGPLNDLTIPLTRYNAFARAEYEIVPQAKAYAQLNYTTYDSSTQLAPSPASGSPTGAPFASPPSIGGTGFWIPVTNPFIPTGLKTILASRANPNAPFLFRDRFTAIGPRVSDNSYSVLQMIVGVGGNVGYGDFTYDLYGSYGKEERVETQFGNVSHQAVRTLLEAADGGASQCTGGYNPFGLAAVSDSCKAFVSRTTKNLTQLEERIVEGNVQGSAFNLPAGAVKIALGFDYKSDKYNFVPDSVLSSIDSANLGTPLQNYAPGVVGFNANNPLSGFTDQKEGYGEALIPVVKDLPLVKLLNIDLAARYSDYNSVGGVWTYKASAEWTVIDQVFLRGGYSRAIRAPSVGELFAPTNQNFPAIGSPTAGAPYAGDPCDVRSGWRTGSTAAQVRALCLAQGVPTAIIDTYQFPNSQSQALTGGNPNLKQEVADTYSVGMVLTPKFDAPLLNRFRMSVDYYNIDIENAIGTIGASNSLADCFNGKPGAPATNPTLTNANLFCQNIVRDTATGQLLNIIDTNANLGSFKTDGIDFQIDWGFDLDALGLDHKWGSITTNLIGTRLLTFDITPVPGGITEHHVGTLSNTIGSNYPDWKFLWSLTWDVGPVSVGGRWRYEGAVNDFNLSSTTTPVLAAPGVSYFDLTGRWKVNNMFELRVGINNITDKQPPIIPTPIQANTDPSAYDVLGRRWYVGVRAKF